jgi:hypothetical protein
MHITSFVQGPSGVPFEARAPGVVQSFERGDKLINLLLLALLSGWFTHSATPFVWHAADVHIPPELRPECAKHRRGHRSDRERF